MSAGWAVVRQGGFRWRVRPGLEAWLLARDWTPPAEAGRGVRIVKRWGSRLSAVLADAAPGGGDLFVKWCGLRHAGEMLKYLVRPSRPAAEWRMSARLAAAGIPVAECLALGERRVGGFWRAGVLAVRAATPGLTLAAVLGDADAAKAKRVADEAARLVARLHDAGFYHRDLHGDNLLLDRGNGTGARLWLADLHEAVGPGVVPEACWVADLARLNGYTPGSPRARLLFWVRYARERKLDPMRRKGWVRTIDRETRRLWERHFQKRGVRIERY